MSVLSQCQLHWLLKCTCSRGRLYQNRISTPWLEDFNEYYNKKLKTTAPDNQGTQSFKDI